MAVNYRLSLKTTRMNDVKTDIDSGAGAAYIEICTAAYALVLATITLSDPCGSVTNDVLTLTMPKSDTSADATGTAAVARIKESAGTVIVNGLTVGTSGTDIVLTSVLITILDTVTINSATITGDLIATEGGDTASFSGEVVEQIPQGLGGGGGYPVYGKYKRPKGISEFLDIAMQDIYQEATKKTAPKQLKAKIVKIVKPYKKEDSIDWDAFEKDTIRVQEMIDLWDKQIMEEDELIIMAYMEYFH